MIRTYFYLRLVLLVACAGLVMDTSRRLVAQEVAEASPAEQSANGQGSDQAIHDQLRQLRDQFIAAVNGKDSEAILALLHPRVVLTAQDGKELSTVRGREGVQDYLERLVLGPEKGIESLKLDPQADDLSEIFNGYTAIAFGTSSDHYVTVSGSEFDLRTRWSAAVIKEGDRWLVASLHVSTNLFDNPVIAAAAKATTWIAIATGVIGLVVGLLLGRRKRAVAVPG